MQSGSTTEIFQMLPWIGGYNTSEDAAVIEPNELTQAENLIFGVRGSRAKRDGINFDWDSASAGSVNILAQCDYWFGNSPKTQKHVAIGDNGVVYSYDSSGNRTTITDSGTAWGSAITTASFEVMNSILIIAVDGTGNVMKKWTGTGNLQNLGVNTASATTTNGSNVLTAVSSIKGASVLGSISGSGIPANSFISIVGTNTLTIVDSSGNAANITTSGTVTNVAITYTNPVPLGSIVRQHLGRIWSNDKTLPDRLNYTTTANPEEWQGLGDSGALDYGVGDGDPIGIMSIFPSFQKVLFVGKFGKLYRTDGFTPATFQITTVSTGIGSIAHNGIAVEDQEDMYFISGKGVHSISTTLQAGDLEEEFVSFKIQQTFNDKWTKGALPKMHAVYLNHINSIAFAAPDTTFSAVGNSAIWLYNIPLKSWYLWPSIPCQSLCLVSDSDKNRIYVGGNNSRIYKTFNGTNYDVANDGSQIAIIMNIKTGLIYLKKNPFIVNGFKKFSLVYGPKGTSTITASIKIDNYSTQSGAFSAAQSADLLGSTFILGTSILGYSFVTGPYTFSIDGYGRGFQLSLTQSGISEQAEIQGFAIEFEALGTAQETILNG